MRRDPRTLSIAISLIPVSVVLHAPAAGPSSAPGSITSENNGLELVLAQQDKSIGATVLGREAGDLIQLLVLAVSQKLKLSAVAKFILPYPTRSEIGKSAAGAFYAPKLFSPWPKRLVRLRLSAA